MSRRGSRLRLYIKYLLDHDTIYPIVSIDTGNGWNIQGFIDQAQKERGSFIYYNDWRYLKDYRLLEQCKWDPKKGWEFGRRPEWLKRSAAKTGLKLRFVYACWNSI